MSKATLFSIEGKKLKTIELPVQFTEAYRPDLIKRAYEVFQSHNTQPYGAFPEAGKRQSAKLPRRRRKYKTSYGHGISRVPRKVTWKRGTQFGWVAAVAPGTVSGRKAHPPKAKKRIIQKINNQERKKAIRSALTTTLDKDLVKNRGHIFTELTPIIEQKIETVTKTKEMKKMLKALGLEKELARVAIRKIRAGRGKQRGRKYKTKKRSFTSSCRNMQDGKSCS